MKGSTLAARVSAINGGNKDTASTTGGVARRADGSRAVGGATMAARPGQGIFGMNNTTVLIGGGVVVLLVLFVVLKK